MTDLDNAELRGTGPKWENVMTDHKDDLPHTIKDDDTGGGKPPRPVRSTRSKPLTGP